MRPLLPAITQQEAGERLWFAGGEVTFRVTSRESGGEILVFDHVAGRGKTTPLHLHAGYDELGYVLEGEILFHVDGEEHRAGPGAVVWVPRGTPHAMLVTSEVARSLWVVTPGTVMEDFMRQAGDAASSGALPPPKIDVERLVAAGERTGAMEVFGPPPFEAAAVA